MKSSTIDPEVIAVSHQLHDDYQTYMLDKIQYAKATNQSLSSVNKKIHVGRGVAAYQKSDSGKVYFSILETAKFLCNNNVRVY